jgi:hypothetical protein
VIRYLLTLWSRPMAFRGDPVGHALNQLGHLCVGAALALVLPLWGGAVVVVAWETSQLVFRDADPGDCVEDATFMIGGAQPVFWPALALLLATGMKERTR